MFQRILAWIDGILLTSQKHLSDGEYEITIMSSFVPDKWIGVIGEDGKMHTIIGAEAVKHFYKNGKFIKRIFVKNDLKTGERLATEEEVNVERERIAMKSICKERSGMF